MTLPKSYWDKRYGEARIRWDIGYPSPPLKTYIDQLKDPSIKILIPGAGNGYEVEYLFQKGFQNVYVVELASKPLKRLRTKLPELSTDNIIEGDFFTLEESQFDLVLEQTFFCALPPENRSDYVRKMAEIIKPGGKLAGLFFSFPLGPEGPPFGGDAKEYRNLFSPLFNILILEPATNSIPPRQGSELFFIFERKSPQDET